MFYAKFLAIKFDMRYANNVALFIGIIMKISPLPKIKLHLCVGVDELTTYLATIGQEPHGDYIHAQAYASSWVDSKRNFHGIVYLNSDLKGKRLIRAVLIHEAVHVFQAYCDAINESDPSTEFQAYAVEAIAGGLMRLYRKRNKAKEKEVIVGGPDAARPSGQPISEKESPITLIYSDSRGIVGLAINGEKIPDGVVREIVGYGGRSSRKPELKITVPYKVGLEPINGILYYKGEPIDGVRVLQWGADVLSIDIHLILDNFPSYEYSI